MSQCSVLSAQCTFSSKTAVLIIALLLGHGALSTVHGDEGDAAWAQRDKPGQTEKAAELWAKSAKGNTDVLIKLSKAYGRLYRHTDAEKEKDQWSEKARKTAAEAVQLSPQNSDALAANAEALGQYAQAHKGVHSLSLVKEAVADLEKAVKIKPENAYAHMLLSSYYRESPKHLSVGDPAKALEQAKLAVQYGPDHAINHLVLAQAYIELGKKEDAIPELKKVFTLTPPADAVPETRADQRKAEKILKELGASAEPAGSSSVSNSSCADNAGACTEAKQ